MGNIFLCCKKRLFLQRFTNISVHLARLNAKNILGNHFLKSVFFPPFCQNLTIKKALKTSSFKGCFIVFIRFYKHHIKFALLVN